MPTYEFTCPNGHDFDKFFRSMASAPTVVPCPVCGKPADRQMSAGAGLVFHGTGFYITDYGKDGKKDQKEVAARTSDSTKEPVSAESTGESKPAEAKSDTGSSTTESKPSAESAPKAPEAPVKVAASPKAAE